MKTASLRLLAFAFLPMLLCAPACGSAIWARDETGPQSTAVKVRVWLAFDRGEKTSQIAKGIPNSPIPLNIAPPGEAENYRFALLRGLPPNASLTVGFAIRQSWFVAAREVPQIQLIAPPQYNGSFALEILFFRESGEPPRGRIIIPVLIGVEQNMPGSQVTGGTLPSESPTPSIIFPPTQEAAMLARATALIEQGDIASARLIYEDLAARGSAKGALAMGQSWDPHYMKNVFVAGLKPNPEIARLWYQRALDMGNADARSRLSRLSTNERPQ